MMERQRVDQRSEAELFGALRDAGEVDGRRGGKAERRLVMLGDVVAVEATAIVGFDDLETVVVEFLQRHAARVDVVENSEFHVAAPGSCRLSQGGEGRVKLARASSHWLQPAPAGCRNIRGSRFRYSTAMRTMSCARASRAWA